MMYIKPSQRLVYKPTSQRINIIKQSINKPTNNSINKLNQGFTLVELMVVMVILSIFAGMIGVSVGKSDTQKNRAYYEHLQGSLEYIRLTAAERMQPMGIRKVTDTDGKITLEVVQLDNAYAAYQGSNTVSGDAPKNTMELSVNIGNASAESEKKVPTWTIDDSIDLPELPKNLVVSINSLEQQLSNNDIQPWFQGTQVPAVVWFGTGQSTPVSIEISYNERLVGEVIKIMPDGGLAIGNQGS